MLRRQYKKRRNKKGGRSFLDAFSQGTSQIKAAAETAKNKGMEAAANTQQGIADFEASRKSHLQRSMIAGEYSNLAKSLMKKKIEANPLGLAKQKQLAANIRGDSLVQRMIENRNPNLSPRKLRRPNPKEGGKRKSRRRKKVRKKSRKRKTRRKRKGGMNPQAGDSSPPPRQQTQQTEEERRAAVRRQVDSIMSRRMAAARERERAALLAEQNKPDHLFGGAIPAPMAYKKRVDRQEIGNQTELFNLMKRAKMRGDTKEQEKLKKKMKKSFDRMNYWNTPEAKANKERVLDSQVRKAMPGIEAAIKGKTLVLRKTRQTRSASAGRKKRKTRRKRRR